MIGIFLDIEANGLNIFKHRIIELAFKFVDLSTREVIDSFDSIVFQPEDVWEKSDPVSLQVNGFNHGMVTTGRKESEVREEILSLFSKHQITRENAVYICQNPSFDRSFFSQLIESEEQEKNLWPYHWLDLASMFWALSLKRHEKEKTPLPWEIGISKNNIAAHLNLQEEALPHRAMQGVEHLIQCYFALNIC